MFIDDRLSTVLRQEGSSEAAQRTQFRQLLDILGNRKFGPYERADASLIAAAWLRMDALGRSLPASDRAAMIREPSWRFRSADLAAHLSDFEPEVVSAALNRAELSAEDWSALIPRLPVRARGFLRLRKDLPVDIEALLDRLGVYDRGLPPPGRDDSERAFESDAYGASPLNLDLDAVVENETGDPSPGEFASRSSDPIETGRSEISALVERIAQFKRAREETDDETLTDSERSPRLPLGEADAPNRRRATGFGFSADAAGRIEWAETDVAPMVIGKRLITPSTLGAAASDTALERAFQRRQPIVQARTELAGAEPISGEWNVDAQPRFTIDGHFTGYVGRFRRSLDDADEARSKAAEEADSIRQLLHELRTPVTAVQGYAEVIQQQLFGPAPHDYRALAAAIAADAARILAGFEELDRLARLEIGAMAVEPGESDLAVVIRQAAQRLAAVLGRRGAALEVAMEDDAELRVPLDNEETERLVWRLMATLSEACGSGEALRAELAVDNERAVLTCDLPLSLRECDDIFAVGSIGSETTTNVGGFGAGFALRLARAEARASGGDLSREDGRVRLSLPMAEVVADPIALTKA
ncbi:MAG: histidine kinase dimerization/phospho-acceptor domain-containing protein [Erythrobacter sp.]|uniref:sensor histidine kinase n=1 Tax=Erythrobacter sp. TaxID=1042 RepID=UPI00261C1EF7|nr:histidine kinase dimerization/phospho-acceptor domain-containing protein [Erythrobacter sp.]MDJ0977125.1 histidine kinase dimerization/phospho-acceptor domain-containing protein [Erythrobacter sp.]